MLPLLVHARQRRDKDTAQVSQVLWQSPQREVEKGAEGGGALQSGNRRGLQESGHGLSELDAEAIQADGRCMNEELFLTVYLVVDGVQVPLQHAQVRRELSSLA